MQPALIQHIIKQLQKHKPSKIIKDDPKGHGILGTIFVLVLALVILIVAFN